MAAPTITCSAVTGSTPTKSTITTRSWSSITIPISGETWSPAQCKVYTATGNSASGCKYYLSSVDTNGIKHAVSISSSYSNPATITDLTKASWGLCPTSVPTSSNLNDISAGSDSQYILEAVSVSPTSTTGLNIQWVSSMFFLYV